MRRSTIVMLLGAAALAAGADGPPIAIADEQSSTAAAGATAAPPGAGPASASSANPLWGIALKQLSNTRERPLFSPSRRPPPPPAPPAVVAAPPPVEKPKELEKPQMALLGTIANHLEGYGIFMDQTVSQPVRIRLGSSHRGWKLSKITGNAVMLEKDGQAAELAFPKKPGDSAPRKSVGSFLAATGAALRGSLDGLENPVPAPISDQKAGDQQMVRRGILPSDKPFGSPQSSVPVAPPPAERR